MTRKDISEIFALLALAYPNAEIFKEKDPRQLMEKLAPTIALWAACLSDVDMWIAKQAVVKLCQTCKFPPTIAEMRESANAVQEEIEREIDIAYSMARNNLMVAETLRERPADTLRTMPERTRKTIEAMGGLDAFMPPDKPVFNMDGFKRTYERLLRTNPVGISAVASAPRLTD
ncbi:MAG: hypothetical protein IJL39_05165 [Clostridia bacterium]|nr:hypothetical protein [Clostridia bacterium]